MMKEQVVTQVLEDLAGKEVPVDLDLWPAVRARMRLVPQRRPAPVLRWAGLALLLVVLFGTLAFGAAILVRQLRPAGREPIALAGLGQPLPLIQAMEGVTVSVQHIYVDADSVVVALAISGTGAQRYVPYGITLTNAAGAVFSPTAGLCAGGRPDLPCYDLAPHPGLYLFAFMGPDLAEITTTLLSGDFRLAVKLEQLGQLTSTSILTDTRNSPIGPVPRTLVGPFRFDFRLLPRCVYGSQSLVLPPPLTEVTYL